MREGFERMAGVMAGGWVGAVRGLVVGLAAVLFMVLYLRGTFTALESPHAMEMADTARALAAGEGLRTQCIQPVDVARVGRESLGESVAQVAYPPLWPMVLSWAQPRAAVGERLGAGRLFLGDVGRVLPCGAVSLLLAALVLFLFTFRYTGDGLAGLVAIALLGCLPAAESVATGEGMPLVMLLSTLAFWFAWEAISTHRVALQLLFVVSAGAMAGTAMLVWWSAWVLAAALLLFLILEYRRLRWVSVALFFVAWLAVWLPYSVQLWEKTGNLFGTALLRLALDVSASGSSSFREGLDVVAPLDVVLRELRAACVTRIGEGAMEMSLAGGLGGFLLWLTVFRRYDKYGGSGLRYALLFGVALACGIGMLSDRSVWVLFLPLLLMLGIQAFRAHLLQQQFFTADVERYLLLLLVVMLIAPTFLRATLGGSTSYPPVHPGLQGFVGDVVEDEGVLLTDIPAAMAWYGNQPSLALPRAYTDYSEVSRNLTVSAVLLTAAPEATQGRYTVWQRLWAGEVPDGCTLTNAYWLPAQSRDQLLLLPE